MKFHVFNDSQVFQRFHVIWVVPGTSKTSIILQDYQRFQHGAARNPPSRSKTDFSRILLKSPKFSIISLKQLNFTKFNGILLIFWFGRSKGSGPSIWPRKNKRFVKGRGFVENSGFLIFNGNSLNFVIFHKND